MSIILKKAKEKAVLNFHPWIFSGAIHSSQKGLKAGDTVKVLSDTGKFLAYGHFDPESQIRVRLFSFDEAKSDLDSGFWTARWEEIYKTKRALLHSEDTDGFRFLFSEGDLSPGFIVDCYSDAAVILSRTPGSNRHKQELVSLLDRLGFKTIVEKQDKDESTDTSSIKFHKGSAEKVQFKENGIKFVVDLVTGQKTGFFLDQKENRQLLASYAKDKTILNTFGYSGAFSLYALRAGARIVHTLDISKQAIELCEENLTLNFESNLIETKHKSLVLDSFDYLKHMEDQFYDLIVLDPPAFTKHISKVQAAARGYKDINLKAMLKIRNGGLIFTFSCSQHISADLFRKIVFGAAKDSGRNVKVLHQLSQAPDHGFSIYHPEGEYLKGLVIQVD
jgi:23S rRNA (cytosine1962-C5)-methyltransferase